MLVCYGDANSSFTRICSLGESLLHICTHPLAPLLLSCALGDSPLCQCAFSCAPVLTLVSWRVLWRAFLADPTPCRVLTCVLNVLQAPWCQMVLHKRACMVLMARLPRRTISLDLLAPAFPGKLARNNCREHVGRSRLSHPDTRICPCSHTSVDQSQRPNGWFGSNFI